MKHATPQQTILAGLGLLLAAGHAHAEPAGKAIELRATGVQIYQCAATPTGTAWRLKAPEASLTDAAGAPFAKHFAGPSWQATDGSTIVGEPVAVGAAPQAGAVPWVVLRVKSHSGSGVFSAVGFVVRLNTQGGVAPSVGCDAGDVGAVRRVAYRAEYVFLPAL